MTEKKINASKGGRPRRGVTKATQTTVRLNEEENRLVSRAQVHMRNVYAHGNECPNVMQAIRWAIRFAAVYGPEIDYDEQRDRVVGW